MGSSIRNFYVTFEQRWGVYGPGDTVSGVVGLDLDRGLGCDSIQCLAEGSARVFWTLSGFGSESVPIAPGTAKYGSRNRTYYQEKVYYAQRQPIWNYNPDTESETAKTDQAGLGPSIFQRGSGEYGLKSSASRGRLDAGSYQWKFSFTLPPEAPTSFEVPFAPGRIRHVIKALVLVGDSITVTRKFPFCVVRPADLNRMEPSLGQTATTQARARVRMPGLLSVGKEGTLEASLSLPKQGYVPGEPLEPNVQFWGTGLRLVRRVRVSLVQKVTCYASAPDFREHESSHAVSSICVKMRSELLDKADTLEGVEVGPSQTLMYVPALAPTLHEWDVLQSSYALVGTLCGPKDVVFASMVLPVTVGTVALVPGPEGGKPRGAGPLSLPPPPPYQDIAPQGAPFQSREDVDSLMCTSPPPSYEQCLLEGQGSIN